MTSPKAQSRPKNGSARPPVDAQFVADVVMALADRGIIAINRRGVESVSLEPAESIHPDLADAPQWVKDAAVEAKRNPSRGIPLSMKRLRSVVARNMLVTAMHKRGLTQTDLARKAKMDPAMLSRVLRDPERCRVQTLRRLADALRIDIRRILEL